MCCGNRLLTVRYSLLSFGCYTFCNAYFTPTTYRDYNSPAHLIALPSHAPISTRPRKHMCNSLCRPAAIPLTPHIGLQRLRRNPGLARPPTPPYTNSPRQYTHIRFAAPVHQHSEGEPAASSSKVVERTVSTHLWGGRWAEWDGCGAGCPGDRGRMVGW